MAGRGSGGMENRLLQGLQLDSYDAQRDSAVRKALSRERQLKPWLLFRHSRSSQDEF
jgi:hypothetical protein